jgi:hypothetical protein
MTETTSAIAREMREEAAGLDCYAGADDRILDWADRLEKSDSEILLKIDWPRTLFWLGAFGFSSCCWGIIGFHVARLTWQWP